VNPTIQTRAERVAELAHRDLPGAAALEIARFVYPSVDDRWHDLWFSTMADRVEEKNHLGLRRVLAISEGIGGNVDDYYHPDNSFINRVIETRRGIPISLAIIWMEVGRRCGVPVEGVALPGHFLVYAGGQLVDPFYYGEAIGLDEAASLVAASLGGEPRLDKSWLNPVPTAEVIRRMLRNLEQIYLDTGDPSGVEWVAALLETVGR